MRFASRVQLAEKSSSVPYIPRVVNADNCIVQITLAQMSVKYIMEIEVVSHLGRWRPWTFSDRCVLVYAVRARRMHLSKCSLFEQTLASSNSRIVMKYDAETSSSPVSKISASASCSKRAIELLSETSIIRLHIYFLQK